MSIKNSIWLAAKRFAMLFVAALFLLASTPQLAQAEIKNEVVTMSGADADVPTYIWSDQSIAPRAVIVGLHGGVQHGRNYDALAQRLVPLGFVFYAIDLRGHGSWLVRSKKRPPVNYFDSTDDLVDIVGAIRRLHPHLPVYCIGESLGAAVAMKAESSRPRLFDGMVLASAGIKLRARHHFLDVLASIGEGVATLGGTIDVKSYIKRISDDPRDSRETIDDPLGRRKSSVWSLLHTVRFLKNAQRTAPEINKTPVLVLQGEQDQIIDPESTEVLYDQLGSRDKEFKTFADAGHLLVTTRYLKDEVLSTLIDWLQVQVRNSGNLNEISQVHLAHSVQ